MSMVKKYKKQEVDKRLLQDIFRIKNELAKIQDIIEISFEPSEIGLYELKIAEAKYFYLLREARHRGVSAR
ncbi:YaaL family protein [Paraliobacillus salinarum]|uniref:YaaL family protein n=1 Tax=Paraliobacillus salinarum TaxID=1158996 RepID=UPI0015F6B2ED|nr:YaaL family protein [Paraliobacillus salinarum]